MLSNLMFADAAALSAVTIAYTVASFTYADTWIVGKASILKLIRIQSTGDVLHHFLVGPENVRGTDNIRWPDTPSQCQCCVYDAGILC